MTSFDFLIVGAGFAGVTMAEQIATRLNRHVLVVDRRKHIAGNMYDGFNDAGILVHLYGPHIFHTNNKRVFDYITQYTEWRNYQHRVLAYVDGRFVQFPINLNTMQELLGRSFDPEQMNAYFESVRAKDVTVRNSRDVIVSKVGEELYNKFFKNYTKKQWNRYPDELDASVIARIPVRLNRDDRYFTDVYQGLPKYGYTRLFERMVSHPNIHLMLGVDYREIKGMVPYQKLIYTGPIDEYYKYRFGALPYRSLRFVHETIDQPFYQSVGVVNYPNDYEFTRITEMKRLTGQEHSKTTIVHEYPTDDGDPYYPVPTEESKERYRQYAGLAEQDDGVLFLGRLGTYKYYNMDQVIAQALSVFEKEIVTKYSHS